MILEKEYQRERAVMYARKFALERNPLYFTFAGIGGNCTNFVSQCVLAGSCVMNFTPVYGWFYLSSSRRSASWTGVDFFYDFMTTNVGVGPYGVAADRNTVEIGDVVQLAKEDGDFYHTLIISKIENRDIYICANTNDALDKPLSEYSYTTERFIHIAGVRYDTRFQLDCFDSIYNPPFPPIAPPTPDEPSQGENQSMENE
jgi:hypothetical protein